MLDYRDIVKMRLPDGWQDHVIIHPFRLECNIRVLMVADSQQTRFDQPIRWGLTNVLEALQHDLPSYLSITVTRARHHSSAQIPGEVLDLPNFRFTGHDLGQYDQIWIFATLTGNTLDQGEATALWNFMQGGGGVFATGDHQDLGVGLCGRIPRVRSMRRWFYPGPGPNGEPVAPAISVSIPTGRGEHDTITGTDETSDGVAQEIVPVLYSSHGPFVFSAVEYPHPLLCSSRGILTKLPDHMHEGVVEVPGNLDATIGVDGTVVEEYPRRSGARHSPEVIAFSNINNNPSKGNFGLIGVYDGHRVDEIAGGVGRIVVDSTWHHFFDMNTNQFASAYAAVRAAVMNGVTPSQADLNAAEAWEQIRDYFQNIAYWLARASTQACIRRRGLWYLVGHPDIIMAMHSVQDRVASLITLGTKARNALQEVASPCERVRITWRPPILVDLDPWIIWQRELRWKPQVPLLPGSMIEDLTLGAQVEAATRLLADANDADTASKIIDSEDFDAELEKAVAEGIVGLSERLRMDADRLMELTRS